MSSDQQNYLEAIEAEESRLRERLVKLAKLKELAIELGIAPDIGAYQPPKAEHTSPLPPPYAREEPAQTDIGATSEPKIEPFDGTFKELIALYRSHPRSPYHKLKHSVRKNYDQGLNRLEKQVGSERVAEWSATRVQTSYDTKWAVGNKIATGNSMIAKLRLLCSFGSVVLDSNACTQLSTIIGNMRFAPTPQRSQVLTFQQARAIRAVAHSQFAWPSIALAQAFSFEIPKLRQVDILGQWVPMSEPGPNDINNGTEKWIDGLLWSDIDLNNMILRREFEGRSGEPRLVHHDLRRFAMVMEEINKVPPWQRTGPLIKCEFTDKPWSASEFRRKWRLVADEAGVPRDIKISDGTRGNASSSKSAEEPDDEI